MPSYVDPCGQEAFLPFMMPGTPSTSTSSAQLDKSFMSMQMQMQLMMMKMLGRWERHHQRRRQSQLPSQLPRWWRLSRHHWLLHFRRSSRSPYQLLSSPLWQHHLHWISRPCLQQYQLRMWTPLGLNLGGRQQWGIGADHHCSQSREDGIFIDTQIVWRESICGIARLIIILSPGLQAHLKSRLQTGSTDPVVHLDF